MNNIVGLGGTIVNLYFSAALAKSNGICYAFFVGMLICIGSLFILTFLLLLDHFIEQNLEDENKKQVCRAILEDELGFISGSNTLSLYNQIVAKEKDPKSDAT